MKIPTHGDTGYIVECDLQYPPELQELRSDYPIAPEHLTVSPDMLSDFCSEIKDKNWKPSQKLIPNLLNKTKYVCHYRNLQFYITHGFVLTKIHRIISFDQKPWHVLTIAPNAAKWPDMNLNRIWQNYRQTQLLARPWNR